MGESRRRAAAVAAGRAEPRDVMIRLRERITLFEPSVYDGVERERCAFNTEHKVTLDFDVYLNALLQVALQREREQREALAEAKRLADELAAKQAEIEAQKALPSKPAVNAPNPMAVAV